MTRTAGAGRKVVVVWVRSTVGVKSPAAKVVLTVLAAVTSLLL